MKKNFIRVTFSLIAIVFLIGCQSTSDEKIKNTNVKIENKSTEEMQEILDQYTYEDYKKIYEEVLVEADKYEEEKALEKWIVRTLASEKLLYKTDLTEKQVIELSRDSMEEDKVWKKIAKERYAISVSDKELDAYIKEGPDTSDLPQHLAIADVLQLTLEDYNHTYDRDLHERGLMWVKLKPKLEKKYKTTNENTLYEKYEKEVEKSSKN